MFSVLFFLRSGAPLGLGSFLYSKGLGFLNSFSGSVGSGRLFGSGAPLGLFLILQSLGFSV